jgi:hypothetical protein
MGRVDREGHHRMRGIGFSGALANATRPRRGAVSPSIAHRGIGRSPLHARARVGGVLARLEATRSLVGDLVLSPRGALDPDGRQT